MEMSFVFFVILFTGKICDAAAFQGDKSQEEKKSIHFNILTAYPKAHLAPNAHES